MFNRTNVGGAAAALATLGLLAGCSSGPSETDVQKALQALERHSVIEKVEQLDCVDAAEGRYRCSFKITLGNDDTMEWSRVFEKLPSGWAVAGE